jgi:WD40 repeat protein
MTRVYDGKPAIVLAVALVLAAANPASNVVLGDVADGTTVKLSDVLHGKELVVDFARQPGRIAWLAYAPDGKTLLCGGGDDPTVLWDTASWRRIGTLPSYERFSFSDDGRQLVLSTFGEISLWDIAPGPESAAKNKERRVFLVPGAYSVMPLFSADGRTLYTLDRELSDNKKSVSHWNLATGKRERVWAVPPLESTISVLSPDGTTVFEAQRFAAAIRALDAEAGTARWLRSADEPAARLLALSADARVLASWNAPSARPVRLWEVASSREILQLKISQRQSVLAWSPDSCLLATADWPTDARERPQSQAVHLWDAATGTELARYKGFKSEVMALTFAPDGSRLAAGLRDGTFLVLKLDKTGADLLARLTLGAHELEARWADLISEDVGLAHRAIWKLATGPRESVPYLQRRLKPALGADAAVIHEWIADLDSDVYAIRHAATRNLTNAQEQAVVPMQRALKTNTSLEKRRRLEQILKVLANSPGADGLRVIRAITVLERIGSTEARAILETLAGGAPFARQTKEAQASLRRLRQRSYAVHD